jgi:hypothetical protein
MQRAQIAIMPTNNARDVSAAASSTTALTIGLSHLVEHKANDVPFLFSSQQGAGTQGKFHQNALLGGFSSALAGRVPCVDTGVNLEVIGLP